MSSPLTSNPIFDNFPSSKIVSSENSKLTFNEEIFNNVIDDFRQAYPILNETPVTLLSILGTPSDEMYLVTKSLITYYSDNETQIPVSPVTSTHKDLSTSAIYLLNRPFCLTLDNGTTTAVWILYLHQGECGGSEDIDALQKLLLLISSRITEVEFEKEDFRILKNWTDLEATFDKSKLTLGLCGSFLYILPFKSQLFSADKNLSLITSNIARQILLERIRGSRGYPDTTVFEKMQDVSVITLKSLPNPLYHGSVCQNKNLERGMVQMLKVPIAELHKESKPNPKIDQSGKVIRHGELSTFIKDCVNRLNGIASFPTSPKLYSPNHGDNLEQVQTSYPKYDPNQLDWSRTSTSPTHMSTVHPTRHGMTNNYSSHVTIAPIHTQRFDNQVRQNSFETNLDQLTPMRQVGDEKKKLKELEQSVRDMTIGASSNIGFYQQPTFTNEETLSSKLITKLVHSYNTEMKRFLKEDVYAPQTLLKIHEILKHELSTKFLSLLNMSAEKLRKLEAAATSTLDEAFILLRQENTQNLKTKQTCISKSIQKTMSYYMVSIEKVLSKNPNGLMDPDLEKIQANIVEDAKLMLESEIKKIREQEPMEGHLKSLLEEVKEYWEESVQERNQENLKACDKSSRGTVISQVENRNGETSLQIPNIQGEAAAVVYIHESTLHQICEGPQQIHFDARQSLYAKVNETIAEIEAENVFNFRSTKNRDRFIERIRFARSYVANQDSTNEQIREQIKIVDQWRYYYKNQ